MRPKTSMKLKMAVSWLISFWSLVFAVITAANGILLGPLLSGIMLLVVYPRFAFEQNLSIPDWQKSLICLARMILFMLIYGLMMALVNSHG